MTKCILAFLFVLTFLKSCDQAAAVYMPEVNAPPKTHILRGVNFVAPPRAFSNNPMKAVQEVNADWIAVIPYGFTRLDESRVYYNTNRQWWGEREEGVRETIKLANASEVNVVLKPQLYIPGSWTGDLDFKTNAEWEEWEAGYSDYIMTFARIATEMEVPVFCIGTEFKISVRKREQFWRSLIKQVRSIYKGQIIYAANWDEYMDVPFWDVVDLVGINAYFPINNSKTPSLELLKKGWEPHKKAIRHFYNKTKKPIVFTEYGYLSVDGCAYNTWELEGKVKELPINEQAQANALQALLETFWDEPYWHGGFIWKWFPEMRGGEGYNSRDYTPQGKLGHSILKDCYGKEMKK
jgi:glycosyl hydrolase family 113